MKVIPAKVEILFMDDQRAIDEIYARIETAGRTCYKSEEQMTPESGRKFAAKLIKLGHESVLEHAVVMIRFTVDRGVSHEIVRHRIAAFSQESTRYCNYSKDKFGNEITFIRPCFWDDGYPSATWAQFNQWMNDMSHAEEAYMRMIRMGATPEKARSVLPNSLKTELVMTVNIRELRHFLRLRAACEAGTPHPQMLEVAVPLYQTCVKLMPELFSDIAIPDGVMLKYGLHSS